MREILLEAMLRQMENRGVSGDKPTWLQEVQIYLTHLESFYDGVLMPMNNKSVTDIIYLDFFKTFGIFPQNILLSKLERPGFEMDCVFALKELWSMTW